jgi:hypothetical protein
LLIDISLRIGSAAFTPTDPGALYWATIHSLYSIVSIMKHSTMKRFEVAIGASTRDPHMTTTNSSAADLR